MRGRARRGATLVATVILSLIACTVAMLLVQQSLSSAQNAAVTADRAVTARIAADLVGQFEARLADDPQFFTRELFWAERPRVCDTGDGSPQVVTASGDPDAPATAWGPACSQVWTYAAPGADVEGYDPATALVRAEVWPPSSTNSVLRLRVLATVGATESALETTYQVPSAAQVTLYSQTGVDLDQLAGPTGTVALSGTIYTVGPSLTPARPEHTLVPDAGPLLGARLLSECGFTGATGDATAFLRAVDPTSRTAAGCADPGPDPTPVVGDVRTLAPAPLTTDAAVRSVDALRRSACRPVAVPHLYTAPAQSEPSAVWSSQLCLTTGSSVVTAGGQVVPVQSASASTPAAYRLTFEGGAADAVVRVETATTAPQDPAPVSEAQAAYAAGTHPLSAPGTVWTELGVLPLPATGLIVTDAPTYVGQCTAAIAPGTCTATTVARDVTVIAGSPANPTDLVLAAPVSGGGGADLGLVATGRLTIPFYAHVGGQAMAVDGHLFALGLGAGGQPSVVTTTADGHTGTTLTVTGSLGGQSVAPLPGWSRVVVAAPTGDGPARYVTFSPFWRAQARSVPTSAELCGQLTCATIW